MEVGAWNNVFQAPCFLTLYEASFLEKGDI